ncbi:MAG TPA: DnaA N-terminal domain-containing protein [Anaerolineaceae bacterium]|nr:DnaA N-terminal domain-containing protein [Anaerolineaceae bacterium]
MEAQTGFSNHQDAWQMVLGQLNAEMKRADYNTWISSVEPLGFNGNPDKFRLAVKNYLNKNYLDSRYNSRISRLLSGLYKRDIKIEVVVENSFSSENGENEYIPVNDSKETIQNKQESEKKAERKQKYTDDSNGVEDIPANSKRKVMLQRAYGNERANIIQPDKGLYVTKYFLDHWLPLLGHSALIVVMTIRKVCYWNPYTGETRNIFETEMGELAEQACISVRTLKTVLKNELIKRYFIRYNVRRVMTPNGIRTAGIRLQVRMDDPLTPEDQEKAGMYEDGTWFSSEFEDESENYDL